MYYKIQSSIILVQKTEISSLKGLQIILVFPFLVKVQIDTNQLHTEKSYF